MSGLLSRVTPSVRAPDVYRGVDHSYAYRKASMAKNTAAIAEQILLQRMDGAGVSKPQPVAKKPRVRKTTTEAVKRRARIHEMLVENGEMSTREITEQFRGRRTYYATLYDMQAMRDAGQVEMTGYNQFSKWRAL